MEFQRVAVAHLTHGSCSSGRRRGMARRRRDRQSRKGSARQDFASQRPRRSIVRLYALVQAGDPEAIDVFLTEDDARRALEDCLRDEPDWRRLLRVAELELETSISPN